MSAPRATPKSPGGYYQHQVGDTAAQSAAKAKAQGLSFTYGPGGGNWTWNGTKFVKPASGSPPPPSSTPNAPSASTPSTSPSPSLASGGPIVPGPSSPASMNALQGAGAGGGGGDMDGGAQILSGQSRFRQGIGQRIPPVESASLAALRRIY